jgi:hypothetical protein
VAKKITELTAETTVQPSNLIPTVNVTAGETRKATLTDVVLGINGLVATLTGSNFSGPVTAQLTGSLTRTSVGTPFITVPAGNIITVSTGSNGQIILSGSSPSGGGGGGGYPPDYASLTGSTFTGPVTASLGLSASMVQLPATAGPHFKTDFGASQALWQIRDDVAGSFRSFITRASSTITFGDTSWWTLSMYSYKIELWGATSGIVFYRPSGSEIGRILGNYWIIGNGGAVPVPASDTILFASGSRGLFPGNVNRQATVINDATLSGTFHAESLGSSPVTTQQHAGVGPIFDYLTSSITTTATPLLAFNHTTTDANKVVLVNLNVTSKSTNTTGSYAASWTACYQRSGSGAFAVVGSSPSSNVFRNNGLATALTSSAGSVVLYVTGSSEETYTWLVRASIQES